MEWADYSDQIKKGLDSFIFDKEIISLLRDSKKNKQKIFIAGNGGSAATAMHYSCDFSKGATQNWDKNFDRYKVICLSSEISHITAIANDSEYKDIFKQQLINLASKGDIAIFLSASGNSPNIVTAAEFAKKELEMVVVGITGFKGGKLKQIADYSAYVNSDSYGVSEDIHSIFGHFLTVCMKE